MIMGPDLLVSNQTAGSDLEMFERQTDSIYRIGRCLACLHGKTRLSFGAFDDIRSSVTGMNRPCLLTRSKALVKYMKEMYSGRLSYRHFSCNCLSGKNHVYGWSFLSEAALCRVVDTTTCFPNDTENGYSMVVVAIADSLFLWRVMLFAKVWPVIISASQNRVWPF